MRWSRRPRGRLGRDMPSPTWVSWAASAEASAPLSWGSSTRAGRESPCSRLREGMGRGRATRRTTRKRERAMGDGVALVPARGLFFPRFHPCGQVRPATHSQSEPRSLLIPHPNRRKGGPISRLSVPPTLCHASSSHRGSGDHRPGGGLRAMHTRARDAVLLPNANLLLQACST